MHTKHKARVTLIHATSPDDPEVLMLGVSPDGSDQTIKPKRGVSITAQVLEETDGENPPATVDVEACRLCFRLHGSDPNVMLQVQRCASEEVRLEVVGEEITLPEEGTYVLDASHGTPVAFNVLNGDDSLATITMEMLPHVEETPVAEGDTQSEAAQDAGG